MVLGFLTAIIFTQLVTTSLGYCPKHCECANNLIVCTCKDIENGTLIMESLERKIDYMSRVVIHSCKKLTIPSDTFSDMQISYELNILGIDQLDIRPYAMRNMVKYPERIKIENSNLKKLHSHTFAGLTGTKHLWLINVTIGSIESNAFRQTSAVGYVYFRESTIDRIRHKAFGEMNGIDHLFIRGKFKIGAIDDHVFLHSNIKQVVFEDVYIGTMNALAFSGFRKIEHLQVTNCTVVETNFNTADISHETKEGGKVEFQQTEINRMSLGALSNFREIHFQQCRIQELVQTYGVPLKNVDLLRFETTLVNYIKSRALTKSRNVRDIIFEDSAIDTVFPQAFVGSIKLGYLLFLNTRFVKFEENAFGQTTFNTFIMDGCQIETIQHNAFNNMRSETFKIQNSKISMIHINAFRGLMTDIFCLEETTIKHLNELAFESLGVKQLCNITGNHISNEVSYRSFAGLIASHIHFNLNRFPCKCTRKFAEFLGMLETHSQEWAFGDNLCLIPSKNITLPISTRTFRKECPRDLMVIKENPQEDNNLLCQHLGLLTECVCATREAKVTLSYKFSSQLPKYTSRLIFSDCKSFHLESMTLSANPEMSGTTDYLNYLTTVTFRQIKHLTFASQTFSGLYNLKVILIDNCQMANLEKKTFNYLPSVTSVIITDTEVPVIRSEAFHQCKIDNLIFRKSQIDAIERRAFAESIIGNLTFTQSRIGFIQEEAVGESTPISRFKIDNSNIETISQGAISAMNSFELCFTKNQISCQCENNGLEIFLELNSCESKSNVCNSPSEVNNESVETVYGSTKGYYFNEECLSAALNGAISGAIFSNSFIFSFSILGAFGWLLF